MKSFLFFLLTIVCLSSKAQEWKLLSPLKSGTEVHGCSFIDDLHGFAVLFAEGDLVETMDGGITWRRPWAPTINGNLYDIEFVTEDLLFTCGSNGGLWRSQDGGNSWVDQNPPTNEWLYQLHFINPQVGVACGFNGTIIRTENGGDSWQLITSGTTNRLWGIDFVNDTLGFISGWNGTILKTIDAGLSWTQLASGSTVSFQGVSFVTDQIGFVSGTSGTVLKTINGGTSWTSSVTGGNSLLYYVHFRTTQIGWAVGSLGTYYTTSNGGSTWNTTGTLGTNDMYCGHYNSSGVAYLMGKQQMYKSTNNGSSWTLIKNHVTNSSFKDIWFEDDLHGTIVGAVGVIGEGSNQGGIVQTSDGGQTWQVRNQSSSGGWYGVHFPTSTVGYVVGGANFGKTLNGGTNWTYTTPYGISASSVNFWDTQRGTVGGSGGLSGICNTMNGGTSFTCGSNQLASAIQYVSDQIAYAVHNGMADTFFKTTDGGASWINMPGMQGGNNCMHFISENEGWVGSIGSVWHTVDGGTTWEEFYAGGATTIVGIHFYTPTSGFIVDQGNNIYKTSDGGATWTNLLGTYTTMFGCYKGFFTENYCYIASYGGDIYRTELGCGDFQAANIVGDNMWCENYYGSLFVPLNPGGLTYEWTLPPGWTGAENSASIEPLPSDQGGLVSVTVTNACGLQSTVYYDVNVTPQVEMNFTISGPTAVCANGSYEYTIPFDPAATEYLWQVTSQFSFTTNENVATITSATGNGLVIGRSSNECGTSNYAQVNVSLLASPTVTLDLVPDSICAAEFLILEGGQPLGGTYSGPGVSNGLLDAPQVVGQQVEISYAYSAGNGCDGSASDYMDIYGSIMSPANFNDDCEVNSEDLDLFMASFGCINNCGNFDLDNDGIVGVQDLMAFVGMLTEYS